jgi:hypothetical protein
MLMLLNFYRHRSVNGYIVVHAYRTVLRPGFVVRSGVGSTSGGAVIPGVPGRPPDPR